MVFWVYAYQPLYSSFLLQKNLLSRLILLLSFQLKVHGFPSQDLLDQEEKNRFQLANMDTILQQSEIEEHILN